MQLGTVPRIPQRTGFEYRQPRTVACLLLGGGAQAAAIAMSFEIAVPLSARLMAIAAVDPFASSTRSTFSGKLWSLVEDVDLTAMRASARSAVEEFEHQDRESLLMVSQVIGGPAVRALAAKMAGVDLVLVPANVAIDGSWAGSKSEVADFLTRRSHTSILRVSRKPLDVRKIIFVVSNTERCSGLAHRHLKLNLWPEASISILPIGDYRPRVLQNAREQLDLLQARGRDAGLLLPIDLDFEAADLEQILSPFHAAVMGHLSYQAGWFDSVRADPFETVASSVSVVLIP